MTPTTSGPQLCLPTGKPRESSPTGISLAYQEWIPRLAQWELYVTLTYDPKRERQNDTPPSHWASSSHLALWHRSASRLLGRPTYLCAALEHQKNGWPHWHGLLAAGAITPREFAALSADWYAARGRTYFARIQAGTQPAVAAYCAKYLCKDGGEMALLGPWQTRKATLQAHF